MNIGKILIFGSLIIACNSVMADDISPKEFIDCYKKAVNERIQEIKKDNPKAKLCDKISKTEERLLDNLYLEEVIVDGEYTSFSNEAMTESSIQSHYKFIKSEKQKYDVSCYESRFHLLKRTDLDLIEEAFEKMFNVDLGFKGWSEKVGNQDLSYCK